MSTHRQTPGTVEPKEQPSISPVVRNIGLLGRIFRYAIAVFLAAIAYRMAAATGDWIMPAMLLFFSLSIWWRAGCSNTKDRP